MINCKDEFKLQWTRQCVLPVARVDNVNANDDDIIFSIKDEKLYVPDVILSTKDNKELSKLASKGFERSVYWNEYKTKSDHQKVSKYYKHDCR